MKRQPVLILALVALAWAASTACQRAPVAAAAPAEAAAAEVPVVPAARVERTELTRDMVLTGELLPFQEVEVMAKVAGYVQRIYVDVGDFVRQGQLLAVLEVPEMKDDITRASAALERSRADLERFAQDVERAEKAHQIAHLGFTRLDSVFRARSGLIAQQEVDDARAKDQMAEAQLAAARSALAAAREQIKVGEADRGKAETLLLYTRVTAPFDGVVTKRYASNGSMIQAGVASQSQAMPLVRLSQNHRLRLVLDVPESAVASVKVGTSVAVRVPSLDKEFPGRVARTSDRVSPTTRTMHTEVDVENGARQLMPGLSAEVTLVLAQNRGALAVPLGALAREGDARFVWVVRPDQRLERRTVREGILSPLQVELTHGVREGEVVVVGHRGRMREGELVRVRLDTAALAGGR